MTAPEKRLPFPQSCLRRLTFQLQCCASQPPCQDLQALNNSASIHAFDDVLVGDQASFWHERARLPAPGRCAGSGATHQNDQVHSRAARTGWAGRMQPANRSVARSEKTRMLDSHPVLTPAITRFFRVQRYPVCSRYVLAAWRHHSRLAAVARIAQPDRPRQCQR